MAKKANLKKKKPTGKAKPKQKAKRPTLKKTKSPKKKSVVKKMKVKTKAKTPLKVVKKIAKPLPVQKSKALPKIPQKIGTVSVTAPIGNVILKPGMRPFKKGVIMKPLPPPPPRDPNERMPQLVIRKKKSERLLEPPPPPPPPVVKVVTIVKSESTGKKKPEPPGKYTLEYIIHSPLGILFEMLSSPTGLTEWFAEEVILKDGYFLFIWDGVPNKAKMVNYKDDRLVRFQWDDRGDKYFEFRLQTDELTNEVSLFVTDFMEDGGDMPSAKLPWDKQISNLKQLLGS